MLSNMNIIFSCTVFQVSSDLQFKSKFSEEIQINELNLLAIENTVIIVPMVHVGLHSVGTYHKKVGWENKKMYFVECQPVDTQQRIFFAECQCSALGKG